MNPQNMIIKNCNVTRRNIIFDVKIQVGVIFKYYMW